MSFSISQMLTKSPQYMYYPQALRTMRHRYTGRCLYHKGYCLCAVTGRSGKCTQTFLLCLFRSLSSISRILVASSFKTTDIPVDKVSHHSEVASPFLGVISLTGLRMPQPIHPAPRPKQRRISIRSPSHPRLIHIYIRLISNPPPLSVLINHHCPLRHCTALLRLSLYLTLHIDSLHHP